MEIKTFIIEQISTIIAPAVSVFIGFMIGRRKQKAEAETNELENVEKALGIYYDLVENLKKEISELRAENLQLRSEIQQIKKEIHL